MYSSCNLCDLINERSLIIGLSLIIFFVSILCFCSNLNKDHFISINKSFKDEVNIFDNSKIKKNKKNNPIFTSNLDNKKLSENIIVNKNNLKTEDNSFNNIVEGLKNNLNKGLSEIEKINKYHTDKLIYKYKNKFELIKNLNNNNLESYNKINDIINNLDINQHNDYDDYELNQIDNNDYLRYSY